MSPSELFEREFSAGNLKAIFEERISQSATVGKDGVSPSEFGKVLDIEVTRIATRAQASKYDFTTFKQKLVLKGAGKPPREISIATVRDRLALRALTNVLMEVFKDQKPSAPHYYIEEIADFIKPLSYEYSFIQLDIKDFYPSIIHDVLLSRLRRRIRSRAILSLVHNAIRTPTGNRVGDGVNIRGVPQGLSVSNILSSIYMEKFDQIAHSKLTYFRYVDDIVIVCKSADAKRNFKYIYAALKKIGLSSHDLVEGSKTKIVPVLKGIEYLGYSLKPGAISVRKSSYRRMMDNIISVITLVKYSVNHNKILARINIKITGCIFNGKRMGWMFFFSLTDDIKQLKRLDNFVSQEWVKLGLERYGRPRKFVKTYYEIRFNMNDTKYIPKFDDYTTEQKVRLIADIDLFGDYDTVRLWSQERINKRFLQIVKKEVAELEKDVTPHRY
ncbi:MAG: RNA-directed DNA polymerase (reverse transcriptase) protein [Mesorhizobium sp.]|uniref:RNA-directed DNA polymerase n=1 Tax=Mesorhizobium sp. TaxID=1871066 RepID=UPI0011F6E379|nr:RNA-directed DNA polymerase [Mesorhizobium sp.]TIL56284.1 MAG: RNA-directed DNA polymerase (reverse transcriptase) protein [Mesorhizobium sp.]